MNTWYYRQGDQEVGPFRREVLDKLKHAGVIDKTTSVKNTDVPDWRPFGQVLAEEAQQITASQPRYYYLDPSRQPVGPFDVASLRRLHDEGVISVETLTSAKGDAQWVPLASLSSVFDRRDRPSARGSRWLKETLFNLFGCFWTWYDQPFGIPVTTKGDPCHRSFREFARMMILTLTLYSFYLVPLNSRDMKAITGRERMEFTGLLILGIVTFGVALAVMEILWAFDLERHGKADNTVGRQESLGIIVLVLNAVGIVLGFVVGDSILSPIIVGVLCASAIWMLQKEINLYAKRHETA